ncbi:Glycosyltransferase, catalytic subunit of cellulose synthase and poly-beta-1,6-N-acetylglucosamine synthase [Bifidobacterium bohemicum]|uniref:N-acetylglucosaminyltransferase n=1 Tax=Bifidobacterium bohemicum DSM 22767 TaxID=1437606 RepID=A0A086ZKD2_9BIFI|nr:glycosyltransferase family 2 protein [Bifidobacterium bohemicum]KFI46982.1 N-acetylglucosaminyltransferase [Bifidobacterium bohemicum DSM 22767]SCB86912.1 Glycosyltransferase, catalytic subunit of cellulose synthase and poly-beta-1,6-N-acetylglucosamine synthase [Bifidobacterium bohemicum]
MVLLNILDIFTVILGVVSIGYQAVCVVASLFHHRITFPEAPMDKRYAVLISARNEQQVVPELIKSIRAQTYPSELIDIWLVADNCTDETANVVRDMGCHVVERTDTEHVGKGYALTYLTEAMMKQGADDIYDAYFVFDADNRLDRHYMEEMNKAFQSGFKILTSYRNSVNLSDNWVSSGSALWFIRESRFLNNSRMLFGSSCHVGGTGFMFSREIMKRNKGWKFHLLTEDLEFTMDSVLHGDRIGYCGTAILYDEQPVSFEQSWRQRLRWSKGFLQVFRYYGPQLMRRAVRERDFSAIDLTLLICPFTVIGTLRVVLGLLFVLLGFVSLSSQLNALGRLLAGGVIALLGMMALAALTVVAERGHVGASNKELFAYVLSFPIYMASYIPISFQAIFSKAQWKPIQHHGQ